MPGARSLVIERPITSTRPPCCGVFSHLVLFWAQIGDAWPVIASRSGRATMRALSHGPLAGSREGGRQKTGHCWREAAVKLKDASNFAAWAQPFPFASQRDGFTVMPQLSNWDTGSLSHWTFATPVKPQSRKSPSVAGDGGGADS